MRRGAPQLGPPAFEAALDPRGRGWPCRQAAPGGAARLGKRREGHGGGIPQGRPAGAEEAPIFDDFEGKPPNNSENDGFSGSFRDVRLVFLAFPHGFWVGKVFGCFSEGVERAAEALCA